MDNHHWHVFKSMLLSLLTEFICNSQLYVTSSSKYSPHLVIQDHITNFLNSA